MLIAGANLEGGCGKSTCAVNLACELADIDNLCTDRWQGKHSVILVDADAKGTATYYCSGGRLPVSSEHLVLKDSKDMERWIQRIRAIKVDYVVVDGPSYVTVVTKAIIGVSDLVVIPCSASDIDFMAIVPMLCGFGKPARQRSQPRPSTNRSGAGLPALLSTIQFCIDGTGVFLGKLGPEENGICSRYHFADVHGSLSRCLFSYGAFVVQTH